MRILVTGSAGFIGYHLVKSLIERGEEVIGIDNINNYYNTGLKIGRLSDVGIVPEEIEENKICVSRKYRNYRFIKFSIESDRLFLSTLFKEEKFDVVKRYIEEHRTAQLQEISDDNDVTIQQIKQWVREERLTFTDDSIVGIECESCGATIKTGRFCEACKKQMANNLGNAIKPERIIEPKKDTRERARMRFLDN